MTGWRQDRGKQVVCVRLDWLIDHGGVVVDAGRSNAWNISLGFRCFSCGEVMSCQGMSPWGPSPQPNSEPLFFLVIYHSEPAGCAILPSLIISLASSIGSSIHVWLRSAFVSVWMVGLARAYNTCMSIWNFGSCQFSHVPSFFFLCDECSAAWFWNFFF